MEQAARFERFDPKGGRVLAISDIHSNLSRLERLLQKTAFAPQNGDHLVVLGDVIDKGPDTAVEAITYLFALQDRHPQNVHLLQGNCDLYPADVAARDDGELLWLLTTRRGSFLRRLLTLDGLYLDAEPTADDLPAIRAHLKDERGALLQRMLALPHLIRIPGAVFVHAGLDTPDWAHTPPSRMLKNDDFYHDTPGIGQWVVFGHMPTANLRGDGNHVPIIDHERKLAAIDGGCSLLRAGQLNALLLTPAYNGFAFSFAFVDDGKPATALCSREGEGGTFGTVWTDMRIDQILSRGPYFSQCRMLQSGKVGAVKNESIHLSEQGELMAYNGENDRILPLEKGEALSVPLPDGEGYVYARRQSGESGWVRREDLAF